MDRDTHDLNLGLILYLEINFIFEESAGFISNFIGHSGIAGNLHVDTAGKNTQKIKEYIANQLKEDQLNGQLTMEDVDPFTGSK